MISEKVQIISCSSGDILAEDILNDQGIILVSKDTVLNHYILDKLTALGIQTIVIYRSNTMMAGSCEETYQLGLNVVKNLLEDLASGKKLELEALTSVMGLLNNFKKEKGLIIKLLQSLRTTDEYTYTHSLNTAFYSMLLGSWISMKESDIEDIMLAGLLHDIGKIRLPNEVLNKNTSLSDDEYQLVKKHTLLGYEMIAQDETISADTKKAILLHHERADGTGYPYQYCLSEITTYAKIVAIADVFDAMTSDRVYKKRVTPFETFEMFLTKGIRSFDIDLVNLFIKRIALYYVDSTVLLSNGEIGKIVFIPPSNVLYPVIYTKGSYLDLAVENNLKIQEFI